MKGLVILPLRPLKASNTLFLDRDGVLNEVVIRETEVSSPRCLDEFKIADDIDALKDSRVVCDWNLIVVTNQPDLARGTIDLKFLLDIHLRISQRIPINTVYICPHKESAGCACRKPKTGLIQQFRNDHPDLDGKECMVGDRRQDFECASRAEITFVLKKQSYNYELHNISDMTINDLTALKSLLLSSE